MLAPLLEKGRLWFWTWAATDIHFNYIRHSDGNNYKKLIIARWEGTTSREVKAIHLIKVIIRNLCAAHIAKYYRKSIKKVWGIQEEKQSLTKNLFECEHRQYNEFPVIREEGIILSQYFTTILISGWHVSKGQGIKRSTSEQRLSNSHQVCLIFIILERLGFFSPSVAS